MSTEQQGICQRSGFKFPMSQLVREWTGLLVHRRFCDVRNPQDFVAGIADNESPRVSSPEATDTFQDSWTTTAADL